MRSLAVVICTWNRAESLAATLDSLSRQVLPPNVSLEVIVVDNNSSDETAALVARIGAGWHTGALTYAFEARQGKQFALNTGIACSRAEVLAFTDDDILFPAGWLTAISQAFADGRADLVGGATTLSWPPGGKPRWYAEDMRAILGGVDLGPAALAPPPYGYAPAGANLVARRSLFERVGKFSETHFRHMDYEFGLRCTAAGAAVVYDPSLRVEAPVDPQMLSKRYFRRWSFKAGFTSFPSVRTKTATFLRVERWVYRQLLNDVLRLPFELASGAPARAFSRELRIWRAAGTITSLWYAWRWPERYPQWVERYSQKKKNLY